MPLPCNHGISGRTGADPLDGNSGELLDKGNVLSCVFGKVLELLGIHRVGLPAGEGLVDGLDPCQLVGGGGERCQLLSVKLVGDGDLELVKVVENVQLGQVPRSVVVDGARVLDEDEIHPAATASTTGGDTEFAADGLHLLANLVDLFGWERTTANSGLVSLDDTNDLLELEWRNGKTGEDTTDTGVGRGDHGVGTPVNVQQEGIGTLDEHGSVALLGALDQRNLVNDVWSQTRTPFIVSLNLGIDIVLEEVAVTLLVCSGHGPQLGVHKFLVEDFSNADTRASSLGLVARANTLLGGTDGTATEFDFFKAIDKGVELEESMGAVADEDAVLGLQAVLLNLLKLVEELRHTDNTGAADKVRRLGVDQTGRQDVEVVGDAVNDNGVTSIVATGRACSDLELAREDVDKLSLA